MVKEVDAKIDDTSVIGKNGEMPLLNRKVLLQDICRTFHTVVLDKYPSLQRQVKRRQASQYLESNNKIECPGRELFEVTSAVSLNFRERTLLHFFSSY